MHQKSGWHESGGKWQAVNVSAELKQANFCLVELGN